MADQTEQVPMDPWDYLAEFIEANAVRPPGGQQAGGPRYPLVPSVAKALREIVAAGRAARALEQQQIADQRLGARVAHAANEELRQQIATLTELLENAREFIDNYSDIIDGEFNRPLPNKAMSLVYEIDQALGN